MKMEKKVINWNFYNKNSEKTVNQVEKKEENEDQDSDKPKNSMLSYIYGGQLWEVNFKNKWFKILFNSLKKLLNLIK